MPFFHFLNVGRLEFPERARGVFDCMVSTFDFGLMRVSNILGEIGILDRVAGSISGTSPSEDALEPGSDSSPRSASTSSTVGDRGTGSLNGL